MLRILFALRRESRIGRIAQPTLRGGATRRTARRRRPRSRDHALARSHSPWYDQRPCWVRVVVQETAAGGRFDEPLDMTAPEVSSVTPDAGPALGPMEPKARMPLNIDEVIAGPLSAALAIRRLALHPLLGVTRWG